MSEATLMDNALQEYITSGSPEAFRQIVEAHINAVFSQCRRQLRDADRAADATQIVFVTLARRARELDPCVLLGGWLFNTARYVCARDRRTERRRLARERSAAQMKNEAIQNTPASSHDLRAEPEELLDDALAKLNPRDRDVILCRFFEGRTLREVGAQLGISEDAAKQRVARAIEKLRHYFARAGLAIPSAAVTASLSAVTQPASPGLVNAVLSAALHGNPPIPPVDMRRSILTQAVKVTAAAVLAAAIATGIILALRTPAQNPAAASIAVTPLLTSETLSTAPSANPLDQSTPEGALRKLSVAIRQDDLQNIDACATFIDASHQLTADAIRTTFLYSAAVSRANRAWIAAFGHPMKVEGFELSTFPGLHGGFEELFDSTLSTLKPGDITTDGQTATIRVHVPLKQMAEFGQQAWANASLIMRRQGNEWRLDAPASIRLEILFEPLQRDPRQTLIQINTDGRITLENAAAQIESGDLKTPAAASDQINKELWNTLHSLKLTNIAIHNLPKITSR